MSMKPIVLIAASSLALAGCASEHHHHVRPVAVEPAPAGYVYYSDPYYYSSGYYNNDYWYWHDREGRLHREHRDIHERHLREHPTYEGGGRGEYRGGSGDYHEHH